MRLKATSLGLKHLTFASCCDCHWWAVAMGLHDAVDPYVVAVGLYAVAVVLYAVAVAFN